MQREEQPLIRVLRQGEHLLKKGTFLSGAMGHLYLAVTLRLDELESGAVPTAFTVCIENTLSTADA
jgi:hypothetical protein